MVVYLLARRWRRRAGRAWVVAGMILVTVASLAGWFGIDHGWLTDHHRVALDMIVLNIGPVLCLVGILVSATAKPPAAASVTEK